MKTRSVVLGEIADTCLGKMLDQIKNKGEYQPYLANINVRWGSFDLENLPQMRFLNSEEERYGLKYGDILVCEGGEPGRCAIWKDQIPGMKFQKALHRVRVHEQDVDYRWLFYRFLYAKSRCEFDQYFSGTTTIKHMPGDKLVKIRIDLPERDYQSRVGDILSAYDNLIENNQKQIKLLEEAAQRLYKEWFVDLHFPGYEDTPIVDGVPEGWKRKTVLDCLQMHIGGGWGKENPVGKNIIKGNVIRGTDINDVRAGKYTDIPSRYHTENDIKNRELKVNDIVFELSNGNINNIGRSLLIDDLILRNCGENTICASFCKLFRPLDRIHALTLYWEIQDMQSSGRMLPYKKQGSNGINNFAFEDFLTHELLVPDDESLLKPLEDIMQKVSNIQSQFALLIEARDRLLPKLMSGEMEV